MLTYKKSDQLQVINYSNFVFLILVLTVALTTENLLPALILWWKEKLFLGRGLNKLL